MQSDQVIAIAQRVLHPYTLDVKEIAWFSIYEVGQRLTDKFDDVPAELVGVRAPRVFIAGDACHTHSAKAGQGMNVSMQDAFNLGWKLAAVLEGRSPESLLHTYSAERQAIAQELIDFDKEWSAIMASPPRTRPTPVPAASTRRAAGVLRAVASVHRGRRHPLRALVAHRRGETPAPRRGIPNRDAVPLGFGDPPRRRQAGPARPCRRADGRWRLYAFADAATPGDPASRLRALCEHLEHSPDSPVRRYTPTDADVDRVFDVRAVFQQYHRDLALADLPSLLVPRKGPLRPHRLREGVRARLEDDDIFDLRGIARDQGALVVVRPDQYVSHVLPLDAYAELAAFFAPLLINRGVSTHHGIEVFDPHRQAKAVVVRQSPR